VSDTMAMCSLARHLHRSLLATLALAELPTVAAVDKCFVLARAPPPAGAFAAESAGALAEHASPRDFMHRVMGPRDPRTPLTR